MANQATDLYYSFCQDDVCDSGNDWHCAIWGVGVSSIERFEQSDSSSLFRSKLIYYQSVIVIQLIQCDLNEKKSNNENF
ncbi:unnamed protein product [Rotaria sp. Silwood1]|nr:unnamed protein product [Rotaria sp. Silwood1]CAF1680678.1 unnamed protein product [Rotaria sp. Silwood1]